MKLCNRCQLGILHANATKSGTKVTFVDNPMDGFPEGKDVYVHPFHIMFPAVHGGIYWRVWFGEIPEECEC